MRRIKSDGNSTSKTGLSKISDLAKRWQKVSLFPLNGLNPTIQIYFLIIKRFRRSYNMHMHLGIKFTTNLSWRAHIVNIIFSRELIKSLRWLPTVLIVHPQLYSKKHYFIILPSMITKLGHITATI
jgi:hypothetical protein